MKKLFARRRASRHQSTEISIAVTSNASPASQILPGEPYRSRGDNLMRDKEHQAAVAMYDAAIASTPNNPDLLLCRSLAHSRSALDDADAAAKLKPEWWLAWLQKGEILLQMGELQRAEEALRAALGFADGPDKPRVQRVLDDIQAQREVAPSACSEVGTHTLSTNDSSHLSCHKGTSTLDGETQMTKFLPADPDLSTLAQTHYTWNIEDWKSLPQGSVGPVFECGGIPWRIAISPSQNSLNEVSLFLSHGYEGGQIPDNWYACVQFALVLWSPQAPGQYISRDAHHRFNANTGDWGFSRFCGYQNLDENPLKRSGEIAITAYVRLVEDPTGVLWHDFYNYDSKKATGMVGLNDQTDLCYLTTTMQSLYHIAGFRKMIYDIPSKADAAGDFVWGMQRLFRSLETSESAVSTEELIVSLGWQRYRFHQQDLGEFWDILTEGLQRRVQGSDIEASLSDLFVGKSATYLLRDGKPDSEPSENEFWHLVLNVRNNPTLKHSLDKITSDSAGLHSSEIGVTQIRKFTKLPPVLCLRLKRVALNASQNQVVKLYDSFEFPLEFDATPYICSGAEASESWVYWLMGVIVHDGHSMGGKHYCFLRPGKEAPFYKFDGERVTRATFKEAIDANFGSGTGSFEEKGKNSSEATAIMLIYVRKSRVDSVLT